MQEQLVNQEKTQERVLATISNKKDPTQLIEIVHLPQEQLFLTRGISHNFHIKEIAIPQGHMLGESQEVTRLLSYLLERIATAADYNLPFQYDRDFEFGNRKYSLEQKKDYLLLIEGS